MIGKVLKKSMLKRQNGATQFHKKIFTTRYTPELSFHKSY